MTGKRRKIEPKREEPEKNKLEFKKEYLLVASAILFILISFLSCTSNNNERGDYMDVKVQSNNPNQPIAQNQGTGGGGIPETNYAHNVNETDPFYTLTYLLNNSGFTFFLILSIILTAFIMFKILNVYRF